jgi:hypothetical protein
MLEQSKKQNEDNFREKTVPLMDLEKPQLCRIIPTKATIPKSQIICLKMKKLKIFVKGINLVERKYLTLGVNSHQCALCQKDK